MNIIDFHTHAYPADVVANPVAWAERRGETHWAKLVGPGSIQGWASPAEMLQAMDEAGVERAVLLGWYWQHQKTCEENNRWLLEWREAAPDRFILFASLNPGQGVERALRELDWAVDRGFKGIGELLPQVQGFSCRDQRWLQIWEGARDASLPVLMHVTEPAGHEYPGRVLTPLDDFIWLASEFPDLTLVLAHWGGGLPFYEMNQRLSKSLRNVFYDTAASPLLFDSRIWSAVVSIIGADRVLFGTDYPLRIHPRYKRPSMRRLVDELKGSGVSDTDQAKILGENARRILDLP